MRKQLTILMIDDDAHFLDIYKARLEREGFRAVTALDGAQGVKSAVKEKPDLITLDIVMPVMDGLETLQALKKSPGTAFIPVFMLTSLSAKERISRALAGGAAEYLVKAHTNPGELLRRIKAHLRLTGG